MKNYMEPTSYPDGEYLTLGWSSGAERL